MVPETITKDIWWVGVQNPSLRVFDVIMRTEWGTSYNSYLVKGEEKTALIDSVRDGFFEEQLTGLRQICEPEKIDYIICNHTEPDHSGSLQQMLEMAPNAVVVCSRAAKMLIKELLNRDFECLVVGDGDSIDLGNKKISFVSAPYLHWPDTIFTYVEEDAFLSSCDAFGFHFSAPEVFDDLTTLSDEMIASQKYYFDVIMSPFKPFVLQAIDKIKDLKIDVIGPSHGPVLRKEPWCAVERYKAWAQPVVNTPPKLYIGYVSCYGYTTKLAQQVYEGALSTGIADVYMEDISLVEKCVATEKITCADAVALGSPTLNRDVLPPVTEAMAELCSYLMKGKPTAVFGTYGWSGEATKFMQQRLENLGAKVIGAAKAKMNPSEVELKEAYDLGVQLAETLK